MKNPNCARYDFRRQKAALARWKKIADLRAKGVPVMTIARQFGIVKSRVCVLCEKWHSYRIQNFKPV